MAFDDGRLRVAGHLLPQESRAVRRSVSLAELRGYNDLDDNLSVDQHIAEKLSIRAFGLWVNRSRLAPVRARLNDALGEAHAEQGLAFVPIAGDALVGSLHPLERKSLSVVLALLDDPRVVVVDDADDLRSTEHIGLLWRALELLLTDHGVALVAGVQSASAAPDPTPGLHLLELDTHRTVSELML